MMADDLIKRGIRVSVMHAGGGCFSPVTERYSRKIDFIIWSNSIQLEKMTSKEVKDFLNKMISSGEVEKFSLPRDLDLVFDGWEICTPLHKGVKLTDSQYRKAKKIFEKARKLNPDNADAYNGLGFLYLWLTEDLAKAEKMYKLAVTKGAKQLGHKSVYEVYKCEQCKESMWKVTETRPLMRALEGLGWAYYKQGKLKDAFKNFDMMLKLNPSDNQGARYMIGIILLQVGMIAEAIKFYKKFWKSDIDPSVKFNFALALFLKGKIKKSATALRLGFFSNIYVAPMLIGACSIPEPKIECKGGKLYVRKTDMDEAVKKLIDVIEEIKRKESKLKTPVSSFYPEPIDMWYFADVEELQYADWYLSTCGNLWNRYQEALEFLKKIWYHKQVIEELNSFIELRRRLKDARNDQERKELIKAERKLTDISRIRSTWFKIASALKTKNNR